jgi:hypothetical protein
VLLNALNNNINRGEAKEEERGKNTGRLYGSYNPKFSRQGKMAIEP